MPRRLNSPNAALHRGENSFDLLLKFDNFVLDVAELVANSVLAVDAAADDVFGSETLDDPLAVSGVPAVGNPVWCLEFRRDWDLGR